MVTAANWIMDGRRLIRIPPGTQGTLVGGGISEGKEIAVRFELPDGSHTVLWVNHDEVREYDEST